jgi:hypothetical protein
MLAVASVVAALLGSAEAATVSSQGGTVLVSGGDAFVPLSGSTELAPGGRVMVRPGGAATISYGNCTVRVGSGLWLVQQAAPCAAGTTEIDFSTKMSGGALDPPPPLPAPRYDALVVGGAIVATCVFVWCRNNDKPASP